MKFLTLTACCAALLLSGCQSEPLDELHIGLGAREAPKTRIFQAEERATYEAARAVITRMGYSIVKAGPAQGEIVALSDISHGDRQDGARQISLRVKLGPGPDSGTEMELSLTEILSADGSGSQGLATQTPLSDTPLYDDIFAKVERELAAPKGP
jgi:hypothetical protein